MRNSKSYSRAQNLLAALGIGVLFGLSGCTGTHAVPTPAPTHSITAPATKPTPPPRATTYAAVGDSMTEWTVPSPSASNPWVYVAQTPDLRFAGGFAQSGDKSFEILAGMKAAPAFTADALVILAGRNDVTLIHDYPSAWSIAQGMGTIKTIAATTGIKHVLLSAIAPCGQECDRYNAALQSLAAQQGWGWVDPWTELTDPTTHLYYPEMTVDGLHPTSAGYTVVGFAIRDALEHMCAHETCQH